MTVLIVISGADGCGKTTLAKAVMERFKGTKTRLVSIDDYSGSNRWYPDWFSLGGDRLFGVKKWRDAGCDPEKAVSTPEMKDDLVAALARGDLDYIFVEEPFGRLRSEMAPLIDIAVHIDVPVDIALARGTINQAANGVDPVEYLQTYVNSDVRALYEAQNLASAVADITLSGLKTVNDCANQVAQFIREQIETRAVQSDVH